MLSQRKRRALQRNWRVYRLKGIRAALLSMSTHLDLTIRHQRKMKALAEEVGQLITQLKRRESK